MKGLLIKDFQLIMRNAKMFIVFLFVVLLIMSSGNTEVVGFVVGYLTVLFGMMVLGTISYDDYEHGNSYLMTLPIRRKTYVKEKYLFAGIMAVIGWLLAILITVIMCAVMQVSVNYQEVFIQSGIILGGMLITISIMIPIQLKFGADNSRMVILGFVAVVILCGLFTKWLCGFYGVDLMRMINQAVNSLMSIGVWFVVLLILVVVFGMILITYQISKKIMKNKEF